MTSIKQIKVGTSHGETSGVCNAEVNGTAYQFSVGDQGTLTITNLAENESVSLEIIKDDGQPIGFEDLDIHNNTLSLLEEANKAWHNDRLYNFNLEEIVNNSFDASKSGELITSLASITELSGSKDFPGTTTKNGSGTENNGAEAFAYLNNGTAVTARQFMIEDGEVSSGEGNKESMTGNDYKTL